MADYLPPFRQSKILPAKITIVARFTIKSSCNVAELKIERCNRCVQDRACEGQIVTACVPVPFFGEIYKPRLKVVTVGLNPALNEYFYQGKPKNRNYRLALLSDYRKNERIDLDDKDVEDAILRYRTYFRDTNRGWHSYFEKMEVVLSRANLDWSYAIGSAVHVDLVACSTKDRWSNLTDETQKTLIENCREFFLETISNLPDGTMILCDGARAMNEIKNLGCVLQPTQLINVRPDSGGDRGWVGELIQNKKVFPVRGWSAPVSQLHPIWRHDLAFWIEETLRPKKMG